MWSRSAVKLPNNILLSNIFNIQTSDEIRANTVTLIGFFCIKENIRVTLRIPLISTNQRPVFIHCRERFQTILII